MVRTAWLVICIALTALAGSIPVRHAAGQERPRSGGELVLLVPSEPPSYDGHREGTFGTVHPLAPYTTRCSASIPPTGQGRVPHPTSRSRGRSHPMASPTPSSFAGACASTTEACSPRAT